MQLLLLGLIYSGLEIDLDFPVMDMLLWQVFGISYFLANEILMSILIVLKHYLVISRQNVFDCVRQITVLSIYIRSVSLQLRPDHKLIDDSWLVASCFHKLIGYILQLLENLKISRNKLAHPWLFQLS